MGYDLRQKRKLKKELKRKPRKDPRLMPGKDKAKIERERKMVEEYMGGGKKEPSAPTPKAPAKKTELPIDEELMKQYIRSTDDQKCMTKGHQNEPAAVKISHGGLLGEEVPPLTFCKWCAKLFKVFPLDASKVSKLDALALIKLANRLDEVGLYKEANIIDEILNEKL